MGLYSLLGRLMKGRARVMVTLATGLFFAILVMRGFVGFVRSGGLDNDRSVAGKVLVVYNRRGLFDAPALQVCVCVPLTPLPPLCGAAGARPTTTVPPAHSVCTQVVDPVSVWGGWVFGPVRGARVGLAVPPCADGPISLLGQPPATGGWVPAGVTFYPRRPPPLPAHPLSSPRICDL